MKTIVYQWFDAVVNDFAVQRKDRSSKEILVEQVAMIASVVGTTIMAMPYQYQIFAWLLYAFADILLLWICQRNGLKYLQLMYGIYLAIAVIVLGTRLT